MGSVVGVTLCKRRDGSNRDDDKKYLKSCRAGNEVMVLVAMNGIGGGERDEVHVCCKRNSALACHYSHGLFPSEHQSRVLFLKHLRLPLETLCRKEQV